MKRVLFGAAIALAIAGCDKATYHYADDVKVQYVEKESAPSIKAQLGCDGAHPGDESDADKKEREKRDPKTDFGKGLLAEACRIADDFDGAGAVTSWPDDKAVWVGRRICRPEISACQSRRDRRELVRARMGRVEIQKGQPGTSSGPTGPDIDQKDKILPYNFLLTDVSFRVTEDELRHRTPSSTRSSKGDTRTSTGEVPPQGRVRERSPDPTDAVRKGRSSRSTPRTGARLPRPLRRHEHAGLPSARREERPVGHPLPPAEGRQAPHRVAHARREPAERLRRRVGASEVSGNVRRCR